MADPLKSKPLRRKPTKHCLIVSAIVGILVAIALIITAVLLGRRSSSDSSSGVGSARTLAGGAPGPAATTSAGGSVEIPVHHAVRIDLQGPVVDTMGPQNPFADFKLTCVFLHADNTTVVIHGYFAADGQAEVSGASGGGVWRCLFAPWLEGSWAWRATFLIGTDVAVGGQGITGGPDGAEGRVEVVGTSEQFSGGRDFRGKGRMLYVGKRYFQFERTGEYFFAGGSDSPEGLLNSEGLMPAPGNELTRDWAAHQGDWEKGDPQLKDGKGKGVVGVVNYLAKTGLNSVSFLSFSHLGLDQGVYPTAGDPVSVKDRYDVAKLGLWEVLFDHMERKGIAIHLKLMEVQSVKYHDGGGLGRERMLYYREMVARFGHHNALTWNIGEEVANDKDPKAEFFIKPETVRGFGNAIAEIDAMQHPIALHTWPTNEIKDLFYDAVIADGQSTAINSFSLQGHAHILRYYLDMKKWIDAATASGIQKVISSDEQGPFESGIASDERDPGHFANRTGVLWSSMLAGGAGHLTYFGFSFENSDIDVTDLRSYDGWFKQVAVMLSFLGTTQIPVHKMQTSEELTSNGMYALYDPGSVYVVQVVSKYATWLNLKTSASSGGSEKYSVGWFDPVKGGKLQAGSVKCTQGGGWASLGQPPSGDWRNRDWIAHVRRNDKCGNVAPASCQGAFVLVQSADTDSTLVGSVNFVLVDSNGAPFPANTEFTGETGLCDRCQVAGGATLLAQSDRAISLRTDGGPIRLTCAKPWEPSGRTCAPSLQVLGGNSC